MRRGVGLVEAALAALVLAIALGVLFQALGLSARGTEQVADEMVATQVASDLLELAGALPFGALPQTPEGPPEALGERWKRTVERMAIPATHRAAIAIEALPGRQKRILVTVRWTAPQGGARAVKLARLRTDEVGL